MPTPSPPKSAILIATRHLTDRITYPAVLLQNRAVLHPLLHNDHPQTPVSLERTPLLLPKRETGRLLQSCPIAPNLLN
ncbi:MAG: hypothetical protein AAF125_06870 [Chloroflexota bacterium]